MGASDRSRLDVRPVDGARQRVEVDGDRVLRPTGHGKLQHRRAVECHLEQLALRPVDEQQKVVVHHCKRFTQVVTTRQLEGVQRVHKSAK